VGFGAFFPFQPVLADIGGDPAAGSPTATLPSFAGP